MIERSTDNEMGRGCEALCVYEVLAIGNDGSVTDHHSFLCACGACGEEYIGDVGRELLVLQGCDYLSISFFGYVFL